MNELPRDIIINTILERAKKDDSIYFLSADLGAKALDQFREELPNQFLHMGISEQNMIDVAAGLAMQGNKVFCYAMAPFITLRCYEQIKVALSAHNLPVTLIGVGCGFGYDDAGPTHYSTEDISVMRVIPHMNVYSPSDNEYCKTLVNSLIEKPELSYLRIDRKYLDKKEFKEENLDRSIAFGGSKVSIFSTGYMTAIAYDLIYKMKLEDKVQLINLNKLTPLANDTVKLLENSDLVISLEEHFSAGGMSSSIAELMSDHFILKPHLRIGIPLQYYFENGGRLYNHELTGIDKASVENKIKEFLIAHKVL